MQWRGTAWRSVLRLTAWSTACFSVSVAGTRARLLISLLSSSPSSPTPSRGAHVGRTPGPRGRPAERPALPCRGRGRAVHLPLPRHPAVRGRRQGEGAAGAWRRLWGRQRGCRAEGTLQKVFGAGPTLLLAAQRERGTAIKDSDVLVFSSRYRAQKVIEAGILGWCCALQVLVEQSRVVAGVRCCPWAGRLLGDVSHLAGLLAAPGCLTVSERPDLSVQTGKLERITAGSFSSRGLGGADLIRVSCLRD